MSGSYCTHSDVFVVQPALTFKSDSTSSYLYFLFGFKIHTFLLFKTFKTQVLNMQCVRPSGLSAPHVKWSLGNLNRSCEITCWGPFIWPSTLCEERCNKPVARDSEKMDRTTAYWSLQCPHQSRALTVMQYREHMTPLAPLTLSLTHTHLTLSLQHLIQ